MRIGKLFQGSLFAGDLLAESIVRSADWAALDDEALHEIEGALQALLARFPTGSAPNESQTEDDLIWPVLQRLGWKASLRQQNLTAHGREDVPDGLLFADDAAKDRANGLARVLYRLLFILYAEDRDLLPVRDERYDDYGLRDRVRGRWPAQGS